MQTFERPLQLRWSDMDPNFHVRHSVYYDFGAQLRIEFLFAHGLNPKVMAEHHFGPVLFREEAVFRKELRFGDDLRMNLFITALTRDFSRFSFLHEILKGDTLCATVKVDGAWIDTVKRKLVAPPEVARPAFEAMPKSTDFQWH